MPGGHAAGSDSTCGSADAATEEGAAGGVSTATSDARAVTGVCGGGAALGHDSTSTAARAVQAT
jgi:hypothetical protein